MIRGMLSLPSFSKTSNRGGNRPRVCSMRMQPLASLITSTRSRVMLIARSPLRITLGGGGTDLPSYYRQHEGFLIAAAIDKYVYVTVMRPFAPGIFLKYSQLEKVDEVDE